MKTISEIFEGMDSDFMAAIGDFGGLSMQVDVRLLLKQLEAEIIQHRQEELDEIQSEFDAEMRDVMENQCGYN